MNVLEAWGIFAAIMVGIALFIPKYGVRVAYAIMVLVLLGLLAKKSIGGTL